MSVKFQILRRTLHIYLSHMQRIVLYSRNPGTRHMIIDDTMTMLSGFTKLSIHVSSSRELALSLR